MEAIETLAPDGTKVLLLRRTGQDTVRCSVGCLAPDGKIRGWYAARPPTHWDALPPLASQSKPQLAARIERLGNV